MSSDPHGRDPAYTRGKFALAYWTLVAAGVVAVIVAFAFGGTAERVAAGAIVAIGVLVLTVLRFRRKRQR